MKKVEELVRYKEISVPFKRTFQTALRKANESRSLVIRTTLGEVVGFGESCPSLKITGESVESVKEHLSMLVERIEKVSFKDVVAFRMMLESLNCNMEGNTALKCGLSSALIDAYMREHRLRMSSKPIRTDITISIGEREEILREMQMRLDEGFSAFKIKIGLDL